MVASELSQVKGSLPPDSAYLSMLDLFKLLADETRLRILVALLHDQLCVTDLVELLDVTQSAVSHQLRVLRSAGVVRAERRGQNVYYSLIDSHIQSLIAISIEHATE